MRKLGICQRKPSEEVYGRGRELRALKITFSKCSDLAG